MNESSKDLPALWLPSEQSLANANLTNYIHWLATRGVEVGDYHELWHWSVEHIEAFWESLWE